MVEDEDQYLISRNSLIILESSGKVTLILEVAVDCRLLTVFFFFFYMVNRLPCTELKDFCKGFLTEDDFFICIYVSRAISPERSKYRIKVL